MPKKEKVESTKIKKVIKLEEIINNLSERIQSSFRLSFNEFSNKSKAEKVNVIVSFLALLELVKQGIVLAKQDNHFEDIGNREQQTNITEVLKLKK